MAKEKQAPLGKSEKDWYSFSESNYRSERKNEYQRKISENCYW